MLACVALALGVAPLAPVGEAKAAESHALAMHGAPALPADFTHMPYANPDAPKGGRLVWGLLGTFDSLNPLIVRGLAVQQIRGFVVESLMARGNDEAFTLYGLLAKSVETDDARSYVTFHLDPQARFSDGKPVTADDVLFSWELLRDKGRPNHRQYYSKVAKAEAPDPLTVRFDFGGANDRELPLILGLMPVLPRHAVDPATFEETTMTGPIGSGPYRVTAVKPGRQRHADAQSRLLGPRPAGQSRACGISTRSGSTSIASPTASSKRSSAASMIFASRHEPLRWHDGYDFPAARNGEVIRDTIKTGMPQPSEFLVFNTRRPVFSDIRVRQALTLLFDFEWINRNYFFGLYARVGGLLRRLRTVRLWPPGRRARARAAEAVRRAHPAGYSRRQLPPARHRRIGARSHDAAQRAQTCCRKPATSSTEPCCGSARPKRPFTFEILVTTRDQERIALAYQRDLKRAGIEASVRAVDPVQFDQRRLGYEFDMLQNRWDQSLSPGNEQSFYWGSQAADIPGTRNYMGAKEPAIDALIAALLEARERPAFVSAVRALDRALMSGFYAIPVFNVQEQWIARWNRIERPAATALTGYLPETWWQKPERSELTK